MHKEYNFLKRYIFTEDDLTASQYKHSFFPINEQEILEAESRMKMKFPKELRNFYLQIGYGFLCKHDKQGFNRIMDPESVVDFRLKEGIYEFDPDTEMYENENRLVFFEVNEGIYITIDLEQKNAEGECSVYYFDTKIADSLEDFIKCMDKQTNYYMSNLNT